MAIKRSLNALLESWSEEFAARANRIRALIGDAHWLTDGLHKERLLQTFISHRLPSSVVAGHGFLVDPTLDACSREIDVIVRDCLHSAPLLDESGITICHPKAVRAYFEVKSTLTADSLASALDLVSSTQQLIASTGDPSTVWRGICFIAEPTNRSRDSLVETLSTKLSDICRASRQRSTPPSAALPLCIFCLDKFAAFIGPGKDSSSTCRFRYFETGRLSFAIAISDMLSHVYERTSTQSFQALEEGVEAMMTEEPLVVEL